MIETELPVLRLISDHLERNSQLTPDRAFLVHEGRTSTYGETRAEVDRVARALMAIGVGVGDRVAFMSAPRPEFFVHFLAATSIGAIWLGLNPKYTHGELDHVVGDAEPSALFGFATILGDSMNDTLEHLSSCHGSIQTTVVLGNEAGPDRSLSWSEFMRGSESVSEADLADRRASVNPDEPAYLVYTSGSMGRPKGALLTHNGSNLCNVIAIERKSLAGRRVICNFPINHIAAIGDICGRTMTGGGTIYYQEQFSPAAVIGLIESESLDMLVGVPTMLAMCVAHPDFATADLSSVELIGWGGAAMPADLLATLIDKTGAAECTMGYGMTETTGGVTYGGLTDSIDLQVSTVGTPDERHPMRIWHADGRLAETGEAGEIQVKGPTVTPGYWRLPEATAEAFTPDGWFRTGDLAEQDEAGYVRIVGRMSEMFKSGGYNVYPREVEMALESHYAVVMAAVISVPDPTFQEIGIAYVTGEASLDPDALKSFVRERLANYKVPKRIVVLDELPMLPIGKVDKAALRDLASR